MKINHEPLIKFKDEICHVIDELDKDMCQSSENNRKFRCHNWFANYVEVDICQILYSMYKL